MDLDTGLLGHLLVYTKHKYARKWNTKTVLHPIEQNVFIKHFYQNFKEKS